MWGKFSLQFLEYKNSHSFRIFRPKNGDRAYTPGIFTQENLKSNKQKISLFELLMPKVTFRSKKFTTPLQNLKRKMPFTNQL